MHPKNRFIVTLIISAFIIGGFILAQAQPFDRSSQKVVAHQDGQKCSAGATAKVVTVIDGDTVIVEGGQHVRLLGIDTEEKGQACYAAAKTRLEALVLNKTVTLQKESTDVDKYGRCLRTIFLHGQNISEQMVKEGLAVARFYGTDVQYKVEIQTAEQYAMQNAVGCKWNNQ